MDEPQGKASTQMNIRLNKADRKHLAVAKEKMKQAGIPDHLITNTEAVRWCMAKVCGEQV